MQEPEYIRVSPVLGKRPNIGPIPGDLILPWGSIAVGNLLLFQMILSSWELFAVSFLASALWHWAMSGREPWKFWGHVFVPLPIWCNANLEVSVTDPLKQQLGTQPVKDPRKRKTVKPFQDAVDLLFVASLRLRDRRVGCTILNRGTSSYKVVFEFDCLGLSSALSHREIHLALEKLSNGLRDLPGGETLTVHMGSFSDYRDRIAQLDRLIQDAPPELAFLLTSEKASVQQLADDGQRKPKFLRLYASYTVEAGTTSKREDWTDKLLATLNRLNCWGNGEGETAQLRRLASILTEAFEDGLLGWEHFLSAKLGLTVSPANEEQLWEHLCHRFGATAIALPQLLVVEERDREVVLHLEQADWLNGKHPVTALLDDGIPEACRDWVKLSREGSATYIGALVQTAKPAGWKTLNQLKAGAELLFREEVADTELICELSPANPQLIAATAEEYLRRSNQLSTYARKRDRKDVKADVKTERAEEATRRLIEGEMPVRVALVVLVERSSPAALDRACKRLEQLVRQPAKLSRETAYAFEIWRQTLPVSWRKLLHKPFDRRLVFTSQEAPGLVPLTLPRTSDRNGFELIAEDGGTPIYVDLFERHRHLLVLGTTGSGKSVLLARTLTLARAHHFPVFVMDYPRSDGDSTFGDYTQFVGGAYFDIAKESINAFEPLDLSSFADLSPDDRNRKVALYRDLLTSVLMTLVCDRSFDALLADRCRAVFQLGLSAYLNDPDIQARAAAARKAGMDGADWQQMPTLRDLLPFFSYEHLALQSSAGVDDALALIELKLKSCLDSTLGQAISRPSTLSSASGLTVYALTNVDDSVDAAVLALTAYSAALRASLHHPASIWFIDESPILFQFPAIPKFVARLTANGRKAGIRVILAAQDPDTIANSEVGAQIFQNLSVRLTGKIAAQGVDSYERILKYPPEIVGQNASPSFDPDGVPFRRWLLDCDGELIHCRYYAPPAELALVANNPKEAAKRKQFLQQTPNKFEAIAAFSRYLQSDDAFTDPQPQTPALAVVDAPSSVA
ncbi:MAG: DUF87 domain-containing protein [Synechococcus sp.]